MNDKDLIPEDILTARGRNALRRAGVYTLTDLKKKTAADFYRMKNVGRKTVNELQLTLGLSTEREIKKLKPKLKERHFDAYVMRRSGLKFRQIGKALNVSAVRAGQIVKRTESFFRRNAGTEYEIVDKGWRVWE